MDNSSVHLVTLEFHFADGGSQLSGGSFELAVSPREHLALAAQGCDVFVLFGQTGFGGGASLGCSLQLGAQAVALILVGGCARCCCVGTWYLEALYLLFVLTQACGELSLEL